MFAGKPIIGLLGGIGSGKSFVASIFAEMDCLVLNADEHVRQAYERDDVKHALREWWGDEIFDQAGHVDRQAVARKVFKHPPERRRLEQLLHPLVGAIRDQAMADTAADPRILAYVWDVPLLVEVGLHRRCDALVFVDAPPEQRLARVSASRRWKPDEWRRREFLQLPLDKKRRIANYIVRNTAGADEVRSQVRQVLSRILAGFSDGAEATQV
jgi:dephospho-CoA kinase